LIIRVATEPAGQVHSFTFTGVPTGTITTESTLVVADLEPGTYTTTQIDPAPDFDVTAVRCDDGEDGLASSGDPQTRTAIFNLDADETVTCTFTNTQRGTAVLIAETIPEGTAGQFTFTGVPTGTVPADGTLVVANLAPGTYTSTQVDPAPQFDPVAVTCDDGGSATQSFGDPVTRSAIFQIDPGEMVSCTFTNARRGTVIAAVEVEPESADGAILFTGVPSGTVSAGGVLVASDLQPGTYTTTAFDGASRDSDAEATGLELVDVVCNDGESATVSSGDASTRTAIYNLEAGETVQCLFSYEDATPDEGAPAGGSVSGDAPSSGGGGEAADGTDPFANPDETLSDFPLPDELPPDAGAYGVPKAGRWTAVNLAGNLDCGAMSLAIPASPPETGVIEVLEDGQTLVGSSLQEHQTAPVTMSADPAVTGRYIGVFDAVEEGVPVEITFVWQVVTDEFIVGYLTGSFSSEGVTCTIYRPYQLTYAGPD
jgi:hypothetical protein